jgi:dipeptidyl-peptidase-4
VIETGTGGVVATVATSDLTAVRRSAFGHAELFSYLAADGATPLVGSIQFPSSFDPAQRYPVLVELYGAPESAVAAPSERFILPDPIAEFGFLIVRLSSRAAPWVAKGARDSVYGALGRADVDDIAQGIRALARRPFVDAAAIGVHGASYGGYLATMLMLRHGSLVRAAVASSPVIAWERYNPVYSERYMGLFEESRTQYRESSALHHADRLQGRLLIYWGTADRNVAPAHAEALVAAIRGAGGRVDVQVDEGAGHGSISRARLLAYFVQHLGDAVRPTP